MSDSSPILQTPLHELHLKLGAKMVPFAGYEMPVQYPPGILKEHLHTRAQVGLFDVSHMGQITVQGEGAASALEKLVPGDIMGLGLNQQRYSLLTNGVGGIRDDLMVLNRGDHLHLVVNAACKHQDLQYIRENLPADLLVTALDNQALLALQGPKAAEVLARFSPDCQKLKFMDAADIVIAGVECLITRSGYTGEDGYEISMPADRACDIAEALLAEQEVEAIGLGARDSLRLEAGLCLYGHDIDEHTTVVEAGLNWVIGKVRRKGGDREGGFPGADIILEQLSSGVSKKRVGIKPAGKAPIREGAELLNNKDEVIGRVCSGGFGPSAGAPVAMGYVDSEYSAPDTPLYAAVRKKKLPVAVCKPVFVSHNYYRG